MADQLTEAAQCGHLARVRTFIELKRGSTQAASVLWEAGVAADISKEERSQLLHFSVRHTDIESVRLLLRFGLMPDPSLAILARRRGRLDVAFLLRSYTPVA